MITKENRVKIHIKGSVTINLDHVFDGWDSDLKALQSSIGTEVRDMVMELLELKATNSRLAHGDFDLLEGATIGGIESKLVE